MRVAVLGAGGTIGPAPEPEVERVAREALPPSARTVSGDIVTADDVRVTAVVIKGARAHPALTEQAGALR